MQNLSLKLMALSTLIFLMTACSKKTTTQNSNTQVTPRSQQDRPQRGKKGERPQFADMLEKMDSNNDGKIAQSETSGRLEKDFSKIDGNGDGFITEEEFKNAPRPQRGQRRQRN